VYGEQVRDSELGPPTHSAGRRTRRCANATSLREVESPVGAFLFSGEYAMHTRIVLVTSLALTLPPAVAGRRVFAGLIPAPPPAPAPTATPRRRRRLPHPRRNADQAPSRRLPPLEGPSQAFYHRQCCDDSRPVERRHAFGRARARRRESQSLSIQRDNVAVWTFSETFLASDIATSTPISGQTPKALLSGSKTEATDPVRSLTILDVASGGFNYMLLGCGIASRGGHEHSGQAFVVVFGTRPSEIPVAGTALQRRHGRPLC